MLLKHKNNVVSDISLKDLLILLECSEIPWFLYEIGPYDMEIHVIGYEADILLEIVHA